MRYVLFGLCDADVSRTEEHAVQDQEAMRLAEQVCELYRMYASSLAYMYACVVYYHCGTPVWYQCGGVRECTHSAAPCQPYVSHLRPKSEV